MPRFKSIFQIIQILSHVVMLPKRVASWSVLGCVDGRRYYGATHRKWWPSDVLTVQDFINLDLNCWKFQRKCTLHIFFLGYIIKSPQQRHLQPHFGFIFGWQRCCFSVFAPASIQQGSVVCQQRCTIHNLKNIISRQMHASFCHP